MAQAQSPQVFGGGERSFSVFWRNNGERTAKVSISHRLFQATSATAVPIRQSYWKTLEILAGQTIVETATLDLPPVRAQTRFLVQWLEATNRVLGITDVWVYPTNLLQELKVLAAGAGPGLFDPQNRLKPLLQELNIEVVDLENISLNTFPSHLAIFGPFGSKTDFPQGLPEVIKRLARRGVAIVWIMPPDRADELRPSFYPVSMGNGVVVVVAPELVAGLEQSPQAQLNLVQLCRLAVHPKALSLPLPAFQP